MLKQDIDENQHVHKAYTFKIQNTCTHRENSIKETEKRKCQQYQKHINKN